MRTSRRGRRIRCSCRRAPRPDFACQGRARYVRLDLGPLVTDWSDVLRGRYLPCDPVYVTMYAWTHVGEPDEQDVTGHGEVSFATGSGAIQGAFFSPRMRDEGLRESRSDAAKRMFSLLSEEESISLNAADRALRNHDPRWFIEVLRGIPGEPPTGEADESVDWEGLTDLFVARRRSRSHLVIPLLRLEWLPWSKARTWVHRQPLRIHAAPGVLFIALKAMTKSGVRSMWYGARFECPVGERDVV